MKNKLSALALVLSLTGLTFATPALAYATTGSTSDSSTTSTTTTTTTTPTTDDSSGRPTRITEYKKALKETVTEATKVRIAARCEAAQGVIKGKTTSNTAVTNARAKAYAKIVTDLQALSTSLAAKSVDVTTLNQDIAVLQTKITVFTTANTTYQQVLSDLGMLGCKTDPVAFKAALSAARANQATVSTAAKAVRTYLTETLKPVLQALKTPSETSTEKTTNN